METVYNKTKALAYIALILIVILFIWQSYQSAGNLLAFFRYKTKFVNLLIHSCEFLKVFIIYIIIALLNIMILKNNQTNL